MDEDEGVVMTPRDKADVQAVVFALETVLHLNPTRADARTVRALLDTCDRVRQRVLGQPKNAVRG